MSVVVSRAISFSCPSVLANTSARAKASVRPALTTRPRARMRSPAAGARGDLEFCGEGPGVSRHQTQCSITRRAVGNGAHNSTVDEPVMLHYCRVGTHNDLDHTRRNAFESRS